MAAAGAAVAVSVAVLDAVDDVEAVGDADGVRDDADAVEDKVDANDDETGIDDQDEARVAAVATAAAVWIWRLGEHGELVTQTNGDCSRTRVLVEKGDILFPPCLHGCESRRRHEDSRLTRGESVLVPCHGLGRAHVRDSGLGRANTPHDLDPCRDRVHENTL